MIQTESILKKLDSILARYSESVELDALRCRDQARTTEQLRS